MRHFGTKKVLFSTLAVIFGTLLAVSCTREVVSEYYLVSIQMPHLVERESGLKATQPKVRVEKLPEYPNDSAAIASETARAANFTDGLSESHARTLREQSKPSDSDYIAEKKKQLISEAYEELADMRFILMRVSHVEGADISEYLELVRENGLTSEKVRRYATENKFDVFIHTIKD